MRDWLAGVGAYEVKREMYKSCTSGDLVGRELASNVGSCRVVSGKVGISRVKSGENFSFWFLLWLRFCISFCVSGACSRFWKVLYDAHPLLQHTTDSCRLAGDGGQEIGSGWLGSGQVGSGRDVSGQSGQFSLVWSFALDFEHSSLVSLLRYWAAYILARALLRLQTPSQRASWLDDDDTLSAMPIRILAPSYYITDFDAVVLPNEAISRGLA